MHARVPLGVFAVAVLTAATWAQGARTYDIAFVPAKGEPPGIYVLRRNAATPTLLVAEANALLTPSSWSQDGRRLVYSAFGPDGQEVRQKYDLPFHFPLYVVNVDGSGRARLLDVPVIPDSRWSPDSTRLALSSGYEAPNVADLKVKQNLQSFPTAIYIVDVASRSMTRLTPSGDNESPSWSPDGRRVTFSGGMNGERDIYVVNADGTDMRRLTNEPTADLSPLWSPRGDLIAYAALPRPGRDGAAGIMVIGTDGTGARRLVEGRASAITWSPDGTRLVVHSPTPVVVSVTSGAETRLADGALDEVFASDGTVLYRVNPARGGAVYAVRPAGGEPQMIVEDLTSFAVGPR